MYRPVRQSLKIGPINTSGSGNKITINQLFTQLDAEDGGVYLPELEQSNPPIYSPEQLQQLAAEAAGATSEVLDWPATLPSGAMIVRAECQTLEQYLVDPEVDVVALLGEAGSGKSALLATVGKTLRDRGRHVLGMRLDRLPKDAIADEHLRDYLNLSKSFVEIARALASDAPVIVMIDQLDALCDLMTVRAGRLGLILNTVECLAEIDNVHVVLAIRPFEYRHDVRLRRVRATEVVLSLPSWADIEPHIAAAQVDPARLTQELREELRRPQALQMFLELTGKGHDWRQLTTYRAMRECLWEAHVVHAPNSARRRHVLSHLAQWMGTKETLTCPLAQMDEWRSEIGALESAGWLQQVGIASNAGVTFRHQSLFDFVYARAIVANDGSLLEQALQHQGLFIRRRIWSVLSYLRDASREQYLREFKRLWYAPGLRRHIKQLLIDFLGQLSAPDSHEVELLRSAIENPEWCQQALIAAGRGRAWYVHLKDRELPRAMRNPGLAASCGSILIGAPAESTDSILDLLERHWSMDRDGSLRAAAVLSNRAQWTDRALGLAQLLVGRLLISDSHTVAELVNSAMKKSPEDAVQILKCALSAEVSRLITSLHATPEPVRPDDTEAPTAQLEWHHEVEIRRRPIRDLFEGQAHWYSLSKLFDAAPHAFLEGIWPVMKQALGAIADQPLPFSSFRKELHWLDDHTTESNRLIDLMQKAAVMAAKTDPQRFISFLRRAEACDLMTCHMLLLAGLSELAAEYPGELVAYFRHDPRRMLVGSLPRPGAATLQFLSRVAPQLSEMIQRELAELFLRWTPMSEIPVEWDARMRWGHMQFVREHRLRLLLCLDQNKLDASERSLIEEAQCAFPSVRRAQAFERLSVQAAAVESAMSAAQMEKASDEAILNFLLELPDQTSWEHPRRWHDGGSIQASRALAQLTKNDPARGLRIAKHLSPMTHERPVGMVIEAAAQAEVDRSVIFQEIEQCEVRGFGSADYRLYIANALDAIARREDQQGLPYPMCQLLRSWLTNSEGKGCDADYLDAKQGQPRRILHQFGVGPRLPEGNYPILRALTTGLLHRMHPDAELWITILEEHAQRQEEPCVWQAMALTCLPNLDMADKSRAASLLAVIFERFPELLDVTSGPHLIDLHQSWLPAELSRRWLETLRGRGSLWHAQVFGEMLVLRALRLHDDSWAPAVIEHLVGDSSGADEATSAARHGIAFMLGLVVNSKVLGDRATDWLVRLAETEQPAISIALLSVFKYSDPPSYSERIDALLSVLLAHPFHLQHDHIKGLAHAMHSYVQVAPERVVHLANALVDQFGHDAANGKAIPALHAGELVDLALTLQDIPGQLDAGLDLFERLQKFNLFEVEQALKEHEEQPGLSALLHYRQSRRWAAR